MVKFSDKPNELRFFDPRNKPTNMSISLVANRKKNNGGRNQIQYLRSPSDPLYLKHSGLYSDKTHMNTNIPYLKQLQSQKLTKAADEYFPYIYNDMIKEHFKQYPFLSFQDDMRLRNTAFNIAWKRIVELRKNVHKRVLTATEQEKNKLFVTHRNALQSAEMDALNVKGDTVDLTSVPKPMENLVNWKKYGIEEVSGATAPYVNEGAIKNLEMTPSLYGGKKRNCVQTLKNKLRRRDRGTRKRRS